MKRQRFVQRDPAVEGTERAQQLAAALAVTCDAEFLERLLAHKTALDEFGGQLFIAAARGKFDQDGNRLDLVHRDVSPQNIFVTYGGDVKLLDFGVATAQYRLTQTASGEVKGKYAYMSPEQTIAAPLDGRSDVFSLAICMWELLTGKFIVPRGDAVAAMRMIRDGKLEPLERAAPHAPAPLVKAINWALETRRERTVLKGEVPSPLRPPPGCVFHPRCPRAESRCSAEIPPLREVRPGHWAACHFA